nr:MAG TPA: hypothetical protein [Caudoviricetes sp.]
MALGTERWGPHPYSGKVFQIRAHNRSLLVYTDIHQE